MTQMNAGGVGESEGGGGTDSASVCRPKYRRDSSATRRISSAICVYQRHQRLNDSLYESTDIAAGADSGEWPSSGAQSAAQARLTRGDASHNC